jgi:hypothetical protein
MNPVHAHALPVRIDPEELFSSPAAPGFEARVFATNRRNRAPQEIS